MLTPIRVIRSNKLLAFNGIGFFRVPGQVAALKSRNLGVRNASTSPRLWLPKITTVSTKNRVVPVRTSTILSIFYNKGLDSSKYINLGIIDLKCNHHLRQ